MRSCLTITELRHCISHLFLQLFFFHYLPLQVMNHEYKNVIKDTVARYQDCIVMNEGNPAVLCVDTDDESAQPQAQIFSKKINRLLDIPQTTFKDAKKELEEEEERKIREHQARTAKDDVRTAMQKVYKG